MSAVYDRSVPSLQIKARNCMICLLSLIAFYRIGRQVIENISFLLETSLKTVLHYISNLAVWRYVYDMSILSLAISR